MNTVVNSEQNSCFKIDNIFEDLFKIERSAIRDDMTMEEIELWDSLRHMELIVEIEEKFGLELSFEDLTRMQNIGEIRKLIAEKQIA